MKMYRLKEEAVPFFLEKLATQIKSFDNWKEHYGVDMIALEEVEQAHIVYGHQSLNNDHSSTLGGWGQKKGTEFHFTIVFPSVKFMEHDKFSNGKTTRELMNKIQNSINYFYDEYISKED